MKHSISLYHSWYMNLLRVPARYRYVLTLFFFLVIILFWYLVLYKPINRTIKYYALANKQFAIQLQECEKAKNITATLMTSIKGCEHDLATHQASSIDANESIACVAKQAVAHNLTLVSCVVEPPVDQSWCRLQPLVIELQGPLPSVVQWLKTVSAKTKLLAINSLTVTIVDQNLVKCSATIIQRAVRSA